MSAGRLAAAVMSALSQSHPFASPRDRVYSPGPNSVFVFGSNQAGVHCAGAALTARELFGALPGIGEGLVTADGPGGVLRSYAIPTKDFRMRVRPLADIAKSVATFLKVTALRADLEFFVTRIGCGFAGYKDVDIAPMFAGAGPNVTLPIGWENLA